MQIEHGPTRADAILARGILASPVCFGLLHFL